MLIRSVTLPIVRGDIIENLGVIFNIWCDPRFIPIRSGYRDDKPVLNIVVNRLDESLHDSINDQIVRRHKLSQIFSRIVINDAMLTGERDFYSKDEPVSAGRFGNKSGPNFLFEAAMGFAASYGGFTAQVELDCLPIRPGWLDELEEVARANERAWVIGSTYSGVRGLEKQLMPHLNGNALYKVGDESFLSFLREAWMPGIDLYVRSNPNLAYDVWWAVVLAHADPTSGNDEWKMVRKFDCFFHSDPFLVNFVDSDTVAEEITDFFIEKSLLGASPTLLHGRMMLWIARWLLDNPLGTVFDGLRQYGAPIEKVRIANDFVRGWAPSHAIEGSLGGPVSSLAGYEMARSDLRRKALLISARLLLARTLNEVSNIVLDEESSSVIAKSLDSGQGDALGNLRAVVRFVSSRFPIEIPSDLIGLR